MKRKILQKLFWASLSTFFRLSANVFGGLNGLGMNGMEGMNSLNMFRGLDSVFDKEGCQY